MAEVDPRQMKALSIRQPWAWRILHQGKDIENRDWRTNFRGQVLIHASKTIDCDHDEVKRLQMPMGGIVGVMNIVDCVEASESKWFAGKFGFVIENAIELPFLPCPGRLGFFEVPHDIAAKISEVRS